MATPLRRLHMVTMNHDMLHLLTAVTIRDTLYTDD